MNLRFPAPVSWVMLLLWLAPALPAQAQPWQSRIVGEGAKPDLEIGPGGELHVSYMLEAFEGWVRHATWNAEAGGFDVELVSSGYFYGPLGLELDRTGSPHIAYHDHTAEDQVHAFVGRGGWTLDAIEHPGHDGWDNDLVIDELGRIHVSSVDPSSFGGPGVEYALFTGSGWTTEVIGSAPIKYAHATSIQLDSAGNPRITYFDDNGLDLMHAVRDQGVWSIETVDAAGDVGRFASLQIDSEDRSHISYLEILPDDVAVVRYAVQDGASWNVSAVDTLRNLQVGFSGARRSTSLVLDDADQPHLSYSDRRRHMYARLSNSQWEYQTVAEVSDSGLPLGQQTALALDAQGTPYVTWFEVTSASPLNGIVHVATPVWPTETERHELLPFEASLYPIPTSQQVMIALSLDVSARVDIEVFDLLGRRVGGRAARRLSAGSHSLRVDLPGIASGRYSAVIRVDGVIETLPVVLVH